MYSVIVAFCNVFAFFNVGLPCTLYFVLWLSIKVFVFKKKNLPRCLPSPRDITDLSLLFPSLKSRDLAWLKPHGGRGRWAPRLLLLLLAERS